MEHLLASVSMVQRGLAINGKTHCSMSFGLNPPVGRELQWGVSSGSHLPGICRPEIYGGGALWGILSTNAPSWHRSELVIQAVKWGEQFMMIFLCLLIFKINFCSNRAIQWLTILMYIKKQMSCLCWLRTLWVPGCCQRWPHSLMWWTNNPSFKMKYASRPHQAHGCESWKPHFAPEISYVHQQIVQAEGRTDIVWRVCLTASPGCKLLSVDMQPPCLDSREGIDFKPSDRRFRSLALHAGLTMHTFYSWTTWAWFLVLPLTSCGA